MRRIVNTKISALKHYFDFLWVMTMSETKARYKHSIFGLLWAIINPIVYMLVLGLVFSLFIKIPNYYLFLISGIIPWKFFSSSVSSATTSFVSHRTYLQKSKFPKEVIPLSIVLSNFFHFCVVLFLLIIYIVFSQNLLFPDILLIFPASIALFAFTIGTSLLFSTLNVKYRDTNFFVKSLIFLWFYATPIVYDLEILPSRFASFFAFNPLTSVFGVFRKAILGQKLLIDNMFYINTVLLLIVITAGIMIFKKESKYLVDWL